MSSRKVRHRISSSGPEIEHTENPYCGDSRYEPPWPNDPKTALPFRYGPLSGGVPRIRLLHICPGNIDDPLRCTMGHAMLDFTRYQALSYAWGTPKKDCMLLCNGGALSVTKNLYSALLILRSEQVPESTTLYWADAICIDQDNIAERESQIRIMKKIYSMAEQTVVWLGPSVGDSHRALAFMNHIRDCFMVPEPVRNLQAFIDESKPQFLSGQNEEGIKVFRGGLHAPREYVLEDYESLRAFFTSSEWFERIWICQEIALSQRIMVCYGTHKLCWSLCGYAALWMSGLPCYRSVDEKVANVGHTLRIEEYRRGFEESSHGLGLLQLIGTARHCKASNQLDKIYGLLGLAKPDVEISVDINQSTLSLFSKTATSFIRTTTTLDILHLADNHPVGRTSESSDANPVVLFQWPSWVPDLSRSHNGRQTGSLRGRENWAYHAAGSTVARVIFYDDLRLEVEGMIIDKIQGVAREMGSDAFHTEVMADWFSVALLPEGVSFIPWDKVEEAKQSKSPSEFKVYEDIQQDLGLLSPDFPYPSGDSPKTAFWRTLICNKDGEDKYAGPYFQETHFEPWFRVALSGWLTGLNEETKPGDGPGSREFHRWVYRSSMRSRMFKTERNYIGTGSRHLQEGDLVCVLYGGQTPFILRPQEPNYYQLISDCYVHGLMEGEALKLGLDEQSFMVR
jgi:Heterokaryon incompatibility protein (HET)